MSEHPPPDLLDTAGRLRRAFVAVFIGVATGAIVYTISDRAIVPEQQITTGGYKFLYFITALGCAAGISVTSAIQKLLLRRRERNEHIPQARVR
jgi:hypothetical protein